MKIFVKILPLLLILPGCYQASLTPMIGPAAGAQQGKLAYSAVSTGVNYGIKYQTGKFPLEHIINKEKEKIVKKIDKIENKIINNSELIRNEFNSKTEVFKSKTNFEKDRWVLHLKEIKNVSQRELFPANKQKYSYWPKIK